jgi:hypothetical protein
MYDGNPTCIYIENGNLTFYSEDLHGDGSSLRLATKQEYERGREVKRDIFNDLSPTELAPDQIQALILMGAWQVYKQDHPEFFS